MMHKTNEITKTLKKKAIEEMKTHEVRPENCTQCPFISAERCAIDRGVAANAHHVPIRCPLTRCDAVVRPRREHVCLDDLKDQTDTSEPRPIMYCSVCGLEQSANRGDYFCDYHRNYFCDSKDIIMHCNKPMRLVVKKTVYTVVDPATGEVTKETL